MSMTLEDMTGSGATARPSLSDHPPQPRLHRVAIGVIAVLVAMGVYLALNIALAALAGVAVYMIGLYVSSRSREGARRAKDRLVGVAVTATFAAIVVPLISVIWTTVDRGMERFDPEFFNESMRSVVGDGGGGFHAIVGTLIVTGLATLISVPIGILVAVYLVEYASTSPRLARSVTTMVDVMTGIPSIVAGLFAYSLFVIFQGPGARSGFAGAVALSVLMVPVVIRGSEEMLRLVPNELREASAALGVPKWRTIVKVVIPTAIAGLLTAVTLAIARVIGETAPLLVTAGIAQDLNLNPFEGRMTTLPVMAYYGYAAPGVPPEAGYDRGWTAALVLVIIVALLFTVARILAKVFQPKGLR